jgi:tRNA threonylcarbamoyl adenosine modification protein (Sua5/YciO/YrdC/YwlC family)
MMAQLFTIHPQNPQQRLLRTAADIVRNGGIIVYPTDSCYALGCQLGNKEAANKILHIRQIDAKHHLTLMCRNLSELGTYASIDNSQYRLLKAATPGSYTFILPATREVPKRLQHPKRSTIGVRVPHHTIALALLEELGEPLLSATLMLPGEDMPLNDAEEIRDRLGKTVDLILDGGSCGVVPTTIVDLTQDVPEILRVGNGPLAPFGL